MPLRVRATLVRGSYPRPLTADSSGDFSHFSSSQLAHDEELDAQKCEITKDDAEIEKNEQKSDWQRDEDDDDFYLGSQELYNQSSSQSTDTSDTTEVPRRVRRRDEDMVSEWEMDAEDSPECSQSSQSSTASHDNRTDEEILRDDKDVSCEKIKLIYKALYRHNFGVISPDRKAFAKKIVAILYGLEGEDVGTIDRWIRRNKEQLESWPLEA
ncbi:hypothetical protein BU15DRAFT_71594 [Melanogaster broomeanus]|nr:hypothetical protein BU15DRAFT_71594 [Melanogaster broomeanus]